MIRSNAYDAIVVGAGPSGSTTSALLAEKGRKVLLLEKQKLPRYHIGESLMPFCYFTLEKLGLVGDMERVGFTKKYSVQFVTMDGKKSNPFYFFQHYDHPSSTTWQVKRSEFDQLLFNRAKELGVEARDEVAVKNVIRDESGAVVGVKAVHGDGQEVEYHAPITVDATGRDAMISSKNQWRRRDPVLNKIAIWTYFRNGKRDKGLDEGATTVAYLPDKGWFWYIPLQDDVVSVGIVAERDYLYGGDTREPAEIMKREIGNNAWIGDHLANAEQFGEYWVTGEFSYRAEYCAADGLVLVGDAFAFLDPVFSSGVFLALKSGEMAAKAIDEALEAGDNSAARFENYGNELCNAIEVMRKIVYAFYDDNFSFGDLVKAHPHLRGDLTDLLIGNVEREGGFDELFKALAQFADPPPELSYGRAGGEVTAAATA